MAVTTVSFWKTPLALGCIGVITIAGAVVTISAVTRSDSGEGNLPAELSVDALAKASEDGDRRGMFREVMNRDDLSDQQRREAFRNMRDVGRRQRSARMTEFFHATSEEEKNALLDAQIDEFARRREEWQQRRAQRTEEGDKDRERMRELFQQPTQQERKARSEDRNPDETAKTMAYMSAMRARMGERGISMGGGRGGPGGRRP